MERLRIRDIEILSQLGFSRSIRELARQLKLDPQNLTKRLAFIEEVLGYKIMNRSVSGIALNEQGQMAVEYATECLLTLKSMIREPQQQSDKIRLRICSRGYLIDHFIGYCYKSVADANRILHFDCMDQSPELTERAARKGLLDIVLSLDDVILGPNWTNESVGEIEWGLFVRAGHPLAKQRKVKDLEGYGLIGFCYIEADQFVSRPSDVQIKLKAFRSSGSENSRYTIKLLLSSDDIGYIPKISAQDWVASGQLTEIFVTNFEPRVAPLTLHFNQDRIKSSWMKLITDIVKKSVR